MKSSKILMVVCLLGSTAAFAQTTPGTSTTSGPISGSGATTSGTTPASVGPTTYDRMNSGDKAANKRMRKTNKTKMSDTNSKMKTKM